MDKFLKKLILLTFSKTKESLKEKKGWSDEDREFYVKFLHALVVFFAADGDGASLTFLNPLHDELLNLDIFKMMLNT